VGGGTEREATWFWLPVRLQVIYALTIESFGGLARQRTDKIAFNGSSLPSLSVLVGTEHPKMLEKESS
jgi:hypothetical protein